MAAIAMSWLIASATDAGASSRGAPAIVQKVIRATDDQRIFLTRMSDGHGTTDVTIQNRTNSAYEVFDSGKLFSEALQTGTTFRRYESTATGCMRLMQKHKISPLGPQKSTPLLVAAPHLRYVLARHEVKWSEAPIGGYQQFGSAVYNSRLEIVSGTLHEALGGEYVWHYTQEYPRSIPQHDFAAPADVCPSKQ